MFTYSGDLPPNTDHNTDLVTSPLWYPNKSCLWVLASFPDLSVGLDPCGPVTSADSHEGVFSVYTDVIGR